jgi:hypothetical protein
VERQASGTKLSEKEEFPKEIGSTPCDRIHGSGYLQRLVLTNSTRAISRMRRFSGGSDGSDSHQTSVGYTPNIPAWHCSKF